MKSLSKADLLMISCLRKDSRVKLTTLSRKIGMPISTIYEKLKRFRADGLIRLTALVDFRRLGFSTRVVIAFKVDRDIRRDVEEYLVGSRNVNSILRINNGFTFMVDGIFKDMTMAVDFLEDVEERFDIKKKMVFYVIDEIERERFFSESDMIDVVLNGEVD